MMKPAMNIRAAHPGDLDEILRLCAAHADYEHADYDPVGKTNGLRELLFAPEPNLFCQVVERIGSGTLAGYASWSLEASTWAATCYAHMDCLYLDPDARGQGFGRELIAAIITDALARGAAEMQWQTPAFNAGAIRFYERLGTTRKEKLRFYLDRDAMCRLGRADNNAR